MPPGGAPGKSALARLWSSVDDNLMKPLLTHSNPTLMETMPGCCLPLARLLTSTEQLSKHPAMANILTDEGVLPTTATAQSARSVVEVRSGASAARPDTFHEKLASSTPGMPQAALSAADVNDEFAEIAGRNHM